MNENEWKWMKMNENEWKWKLGLLQLTIFDCIIVLYWEKASETRNMNKKNIVQ